MTKKTKIVGKLLTPLEASAVSGGTGQHAQGGNYTQNGGNYTQSGGGWHHQTGGGDYTQAAPPDLIK